MFFETDISIANDIVCKCRNIVIYITFYGTIWHSIEIIKNII